MHAAARGGEMSGGLAGVGGQEGREHEESDGDSDWTEDEEEQTPIDPVDPFRALAHAVHLLQHRASPRFQACPSPPIFSHVRNS